MTRRPVFLRRQAYRRRKVRDAARLLPVLGAFLVLLPILWAPAATGARATAPDWIYLFVVWALLVLAAAILGPRLSGESTDEADPDPDPDSDPDSDPGPDPGERR